MGRRERERTLRLSNCRMIYLQRNQTWTGIPTFMSFFKACLSLLSFSLLMTPMEMKKTRATPGEALSQAQPALECCMCGDHGFSVDLFRCVICQFRSQHRYCSNQYPKAASYKVCNWCLNQKEAAEENSPGQSSSFSKSDGHEKRNSFPIQLSRPIKKQRPPEGQKKPMIAAGATEEKLRRTKSDDIPVRSMVKRQVFRNKVRRYKLLDEVSS